MQKIKIGIPKSLLYYKYNDLWKSFFNELGCDVIYSPNTNKEILENGKSLLVDESCLSMKVHMGHVAYLADKCDYILVPRLECLKKNEDMCTNFYVLYDLIKNLFGTKLLNYNINVVNGETEEKGFFNIGRVLGFDIDTIKNAYGQAKVKANYVQKQSIMKNKINLMNKAKLKILLVGHPYNVYDELIGEPIIKFLNNLNVQIIYAHLNDCNFPAYKELSKTLYWSFNKELLNGIVEFKDYVDGIILLAAFPCGPDSLVNEIVLRSIDIPIIHIIIDELNSETGLETRLESFVDILSAKKKVQS